MQAPTLNKISFTLKSAYSTAGSYFRKTCSHTDLAPGAIRKSIFIRYRPSICKLKILNLRTSPWQMESVKIPSSFSFFSRSSIFPSKLVYRREMVTRALLGYILVESRQKQGRDYLQAESLDRRSLAFANSMNWLYIPIFLSSEIRRFWFILNFLTRLRQYERRSMQTYSEMNSLRCYTAPIISFFFELYICSSDILPATISSYSRSKKTLYMMDLICSMRGCLSCEAGFRTGYLACTSSKLSLLLKQSQRIILEDRKWRNFGFYIQTTQRQSKNDLYKSVY